MNILAIFSNRILMIALIAWSIAQIIKVPLYYITTRELDWALLLRAGGMPSSHSALVASSTHAIGLYLGFDTPFFAIAFIISMIVIYDATGIRRQAGKHAKIINTMIQDLASGHPLREEQLREVLGHTPLEALGGMLLGIVLAHFIWLIWQ
jgi:acid phosphatase family membrane protein YuiD